MYIRCADSKVRPFPERLPQCQIRLFPGFPFHGQSLNGTLSRIHFVGRQRGQHKIGKAVKVDYFSVIRNISKWEMMDMHFQFWSAPYQQISPWYKIYCTYIIKIYLIMSVTSCAPSYNWNQLAFKLKIVNISGSNQYKINSIMIHWISTHF